MKAKLTKTAEKLAKKKMHYLWKPKKVRIN